MPLPRRFHARCFDPTGRWAGRLRAALDAKLWSMLTVGSCNELLPEQSGSAGVSPAQMQSGSPGASPAHVGDSPALLLCVLDEATAADAAWWWSSNRSLVNPRSPLVIVHPTAEPSMIAYWQALGAAAVLTTTLELPLLLQLAERFAAHSANLVADLADPLTPFWQALPWSDALPKAGRGG